MPRKPLKSTLVIKFIETHCRVPEGKLVGQPLKLAPFQKQFIKKVYDNPQGTTAAYLSMGRKNGKTALAAALILTHVVGPLALQNSQVVSGARSRDQAALLWSLAAKMIELDEVLSEWCHVVPSSKKIHGLAMNVEYKALAADGAKNMGLSPVVAVLDEVGQVVGPVDYFTDAITSSQGAHENPLLVCISTQAPSDSDMFSIWIDDALRSGDPRIVCQLHTADDDADLLDPKQWAKANPALAAGFLSEDFLAQEMARAARLPSEENKARNLYLNQRISLESMWLSPSVWKENNAPPDLDVFRHYGAHMGLDLARKHDLCAAVLATSDEHGHVHLLVYAFTPLNSIAEHSKTDRVPYDQWARDGILYAVPGDTISYDWVTQFLAQEMRRLGIELRSVQFDRWHINAFKAAAERTGFAQEADFQEVGQGFKDISPRMDSFNGLLLERKIRHGAHPVLNLAAASAIAVSDPAGNTKLDKNRSSQKIDGLVAAIMAVHPLVFNEEEFSVEALIG